MRAAVQAAKALLWLTQLALNIAVPMLLFLWGAVWLRDRFGLGVWVLILGAVLGLCGAFGGLKASFKAMGLLQPRKKDEPETHAFNSHD